MKDKAMSFSWDGKRIIISGKKGDMLVNKTDAYRLMMVCLAADPRWEALPVDWRNYYTARTNPVKP